MWSKAMKKEARGLEACDLGEVQAVEPHYVKTLRGRFLKRETFYLPRGLAEAFDGSTVWFRIEASEAEEFKRSAPPSEKEYAMYSPFLARLFITS